MVKATINFRIEGLYFLIFNYIKLYLKSICYVVYDVGLYGLVCNNLW